MSDVPLTLSPIGHEALDDPMTDPALIDRMVHDIARSNRWLGGAAAMRAGLADLLDGTEAGRTLSLFDIGTGAADLPIAAVRFAAHRGIRLQPVGYERIRAAARVARRAGVPVVVGCAGGLPLAPRSVDLVMISQVVHHFDDITTIELFRSATRAARRGVLVLELRPARLAGWGFRLAGTVLRFHRTTIADGVTSIQRGYSAERLRQLCRAAGVARPQVVNFPIARVAAWWRVDGVARDG
jgi:ubiquinone/menaquinone biosynthesis C-methylase UbiE